MSNENSLNQPSQLIVATFSADRFAIYNLVKCIITSNLIYSDVSFASQPAKRCDALASGGVRYQCAYGRFICHTPARLRQIKCAEKRPVDGNDPADQLP